MNFLSHFYYDRHYNDPQFILGSVLPDLVKNANKNWIIHPEKRADLLSGDDRLISILNGWNRHIQVDRSFHSSDFFIEHTKAIRLLIAPLLEDSPVRPSFLAHISLELMLDSLLITEKIIDADDFYKYLRKINRPVVQQFLELNNIDNAVQFFHFFDGFVNAAYLKTYNEFHNIMYALNRICMRLWHDPLNETQKTQLTSVLLKYREKLSHCFMDIFNEVNSTLK